MIIKAAAHAMARRLQRLSLDELLASNDSVVVNESVEQWSSGGSANARQHCRRYDVTVTVQPPRLIRKAFGVKWKTLSKVKEEEDDDNDGVQ
jgi:hypothetical protein